MRLVELLARELSEWPEKASHAVQHEDGDVGFTYDGKPGRDKDHSDWSINALTASEKAYWLIGAATSASKTASDHATAIVTRADWEKEKMKQEAPKKNAEGWIRHRGGKCPVEKGTRVDVRIRNGATGCAQSEHLTWDHYKNDSDIMAYRLHKPAEQVEQVEAEQVMRDCVEKCASTESSGELLYDPIAQGPLQWRDRIAEIDATTQALTTERAGLVQKLASEGFALIGRAVDPVEDMSDWRNWKVGDLLEMVKAGDWEEMTNGKLYEFAAPENRYNFAVADDNGELRSFHIGSDDFVSGDFKWHSRPSA